MRGHGDPQASYTYDPFAKQIGLSDDPDGQGPQGATVRWTAYDGLNPYADFNGSGTLTYRYLYGPAVDRILGRLSNAGTRAFAGWLQRLRGAKRQVLGEEYVVVARRVVEPRVLYTVPNFYKGQQKDGGSSQRAKALSGKEIGSAPPVL